MTAHYARVPSRHASLPLAILCGLLLAAVLFTTAPRPVSAEEQAEPAQVDVAERIVRVAMTYLGQNEGQCFPWVRRVIAEATGVSMGFGYHDGFLEGGAVEVPLSEAQRGDVIQIAHPTDNGPGVNYNGLHTVIVLERLGSSTFNVIDSNSQWDGVVRMREGYDPVASANRYPGLGARAYRFSTSVSSPAMLASEVTDPTEHTASMNAGESARIATDTGGCLNLRETPGTSAPILTCLQNGTMVTVMEDTAEAAGYTWRQVSVNGQIGWVADIYLAPINDAAAEPAESDTADEADEEEFEQSSAIGQVLSGGFPSAGGVTLLVWGGGSVELLDETALEAGCNLLSVWTTSDGGLIGHIVGAPSFVNAAWEGHFEGDIPESTPILAVCARPDGGDEFAAPTSPPDGEFIEGEGPPGPAGNEGE